MNKLLISSSAKDTIRESVLLAHELDLGIEISRLPFYSDKNTTVEEVISKLEDYLNGFKNRITVHAMFSDVNIAGKDPLLREISQKRMYQSFEVAKAIGADTILFHTGNKGTLHYGSQENFKELFIQFWKKFIKEFEENGKIAVIENVFETTPAYCKELVEEVNSPNLKLALDIGHVNLYSPQSDIINWIKEYGEKLYHLHIHNNFQKNDDHADLENGTVNYKPILEEIKNSGINPTFVLEMFKENDIRKSVEFFKKIMN